MGHGQNFPEKSALEKAWSAWNGISPNFAPLKVLTFIVEDGLDKTLHVNSLILVKEFVEIFKLQRGMEICTNLWLLDKKMYETLPSENYAHNTLS